jgi:hypothetical protein
MMTLGTVSPQSAGNPSKALTYEGSIYPELSAPIRDMMNGKGATRGPEFRALGVEQNKCYDHAPFDAVSVAKTSF